MSKRMWTTLILSLVGIALVSCLASGFWLGCLILFGYYASELMDSACRGGGIWTRWVFGGLLALLAVQIALWTRFRPQRSKKVIAAVIVTLTAGAALAMAVPAFTCLGPSTAWRDPSCAPPCWRQFYPGSTTLGEVLRDLPAMEDVNSRSVRYDDTWIRTVGWCFASKHEGSGTAIFLQGDSLTAVRLRPEGITLGDTVQAFGEPALFAARGSLGEVRQRSVQLLYPEKGIMISANDFGHWDPRDGKERMEEIMPVSWLLFFDPPVFDDWDSFARLMGYSTDAPLLEYLQPWQGFGLVPFSNGAR